MACGGLLLLLIYGRPGGAESALMPWRGVPGEGFAELILDASHPDRQIRELLAKSGVKTTIGESSQWVLLNGFRELEQVPLDGYWDRVEAFDPRNDGYAERLQSFFVFKGERRIFIGLKGSPPDLAGRVKASLGNIRYSLSVPSPRRSRLLPAILCILASALTLLFSGEILFALFFLPLWVPLAGLGSPGFALAAILAGLSRVLREPALEYFVARRYGTIRGRALPAAGVWILAGLFFAAAVLLAVFGRLPPLTVSAALVLFPLVLCFSFWTESCRGAQEGHIRFKPVQITPLARQPISGSLVMFPFALAALALPLLSGLFSGVAAGKSSQDASRVRTSWKSPLELNAGHYRAHAAFQQAFPYTPFDAGGAPYLRYSLAGDGLIDGSDPGEPVFAKSATIPPFPLDSLIDFLGNYVYTDDVPVLFYGGELVCPFIVLGLCVPLIFRDRRGRRMRGQLSLYMDKKIAA
ncbi:MAG: hypothetical protein LBK63_00560 [Treponema sp.]|nr:hypothetical protein [Treponema sp.]